MDKSKHRIAELEHEVAELRAELAALRDGLADAVTTKRIITTDIVVRDDDLDTHSGEWHQVEITRHGLTVTERTDEGDESWASIEADNGCASVSVHTGEAEPAAQIMAISDATGFGHDPAGRAAALMQLGDTELVAYRPFDLDRFTVLDVAELAVPQPAS